MAAPVGPRPEHRGQAWSALQSCARCCPWHTRWGGRAPPHACALQACPCALSPGYHTRTLGSAWQADSPYDVQMRGCLCAVAALPPLTDQAHCRGGGSPSKRCKHGLQLYSFVSAKLPL